MQLFSSLQFLNLSFSMALSEIVSGIIFISAFLPLESFAFSSLALPSLFNFNLVLILALSVRSSIISEFIFLKVNFFGVIVSSSPSLSFSLMFSITSFLSSFLSWRFTRASSPIFCAAWMLSCNLSWIEFACASVPAARTVVIVATISIDSKKLIVTFFIKLIRLIGIKRLWKLVGVCINLSEMGMFIW